MDVFNEVAKELPEKLHPAFEEFVIALGCLCQALVNNNPEIQPVEISTIMAYSMAATLVDTAAGCSIHEDPTQKPNASLVKAITTDLFKISTSIADMLVNESVAKGDYVMAKNDCDCIACRTRRKLEAGERLSPAETAEVLAAALMQSTKLKPTHPVSPFLTEEDLKDAKSDPSKPSPWRP